MFRTETDFGSTLDPVLIQILSPLIMNWFGSAGSQQVSSSHLTAAVLFSYPDPFGGLCHYWSPWPLTLPPKRHRTVVRIYTLITPTWFWVSSGPPVRLFRSAELPGLQPPGVARSAGSDVLLVAPVVALHYGVPAHSAVSWHPPTFIVQKNRTLTVSSSFLLSAELV